MIKSSITFPEEVLKLYRVCIDNSKELLCAAERIFKDEELYNISFHLSVLALEEIGKAELIIMSHLSKVKDKESAYDKHMNDHIRKLFWAIWGPSFGREIITTKQIESYQGMARRIHGLRLQSIYVDTKDSNIIQPKETIDKSYAKRIIELVRARIGMAKSKEIKELGIEESQVLSWFLKATEDIQKRKYIMGQASMRKLAEIGKSYEWMKWLKEQFDKVEEESRILVEKELKRSKPLGVDAESEKWKIRIHFYSGSHSIRSQPLNWWNQHSNWIKFYPGNKRKGEVILEFTLPKAAHVNKLWNFGWAVARKFAVALNIGSMGFFWWYIPEQVSRFYNKIIDIESNTEIVIERRPILKIDWGNRVLDENCLRNIMLVFNKLPNFSENKYQDPFDHYIAGLTFLSKTDIHLLFFPNAFEEFFNSFKKALIYFNEWDNKSDFKNIFKSKVLELLPEFDETDRFLELYNKIEKSPLNVKEIEMDEPVKMKILCDAYFIFTFRKLYEEKS